VTPPFYLQIVSGIVIGRCTHLNLLLLGSILQNHWLVQKLVQNNKRDSRTLIHQPCYRVEGPQTPVYHGHDCPNFRKDMLTTAHVNIEWRVNCSSSRKSDPSVSQNQMAWTIVAFSPQTRWQLDRSLENHAPAPQKPFQNFRRFSTVKPSLLVNQKAC
jgi:hypothetical protein